MPFFCFSISCLIVLKVACWIFNMQLISCFTLDFYVAAFKLLSYAGKKKFPNEEKLQKFRRWRLLLYKKKRKQMFKKRLNNLLFIKGGNL